MKITNVEVGEIKIPLKTPFKTALREVYALENVVVKVATDTGHIGYGEAAITAVITGDTKGSIKWVIMNELAPKLIGGNIANLEELLIILNSSIVGNTSPKAALDMALYDLFGQLYKIPAYRLLGGFRDSLTTDITISVNEPEEMAKDSLSALNKGYDTIKVKLGKDWVKDLHRLKTIRETVGNKIAIRVDANQGWQPKDAVMIIRKIEDMDLNIELIEQPVKAHDLVGLKFVTDNVILPIIADESCFSPRDALNIIYNRIADGVNIKLMKTGGIYNALKIIGIAEANEISCMIGCMLESKIGLTAACHLAGGKKIISRYDLDGPNLCAEDPVVGGVTYNESSIMLNEEPGLGFKDIGNVVYY